MSTYYSYFVCRDCQYRIDVGFIGDTNYTVAFCHQCRHSYRVAAPAGERPQHTNQPHHLLIFGKHQLELPGKRGQRSKRISHQTWIESGIHIPVDEDLVEHGDQISISYRLNYRSIHCPNCNTCGSLISYRDYLQHCPECGGQQMDEHEL